LKNPLIAQADLVAELKGGAQRLQKISQRFLEVANSEKTPSYFAVEAYCTVPSFYNAYSHAVRALGGKDKELMMELEKVAKPIDDKAKEFAQGCIDGALRAETGGTAYDNVVRRWGWRSNPKLEKLANGITQELRKKSPWVEPLDLPRERDILSDHLKGKNLDISSWNQLARARLEAGELGLSRLTYIDALNRDPNSPVLLNGFACVEQKSRKSKGVSGLFRKAGELGSSYAWVNEALLQLKASRLPLAQEAFKKALLGKAFDYDVSLRQNVQELTGP
jgi:tetratricopeptide (TPR) repeat protein